MSVNWQNQRLGQLLVVAH